MSHAAFWIKLKRGGAERLIAPHHPGPDAPFDRELGTGPVINGCTTGQLAGSADQ